MLRRKTIIYLIISIFISIYVAFLLLDLDYMAIQWDETPHLYGGLLLSRGNFQEYIREGSFYPPLLDVVIALYFKVLGSSLFSARLVSIAFGVLSVLCVFVFTYHFYGEKNALLSSILLASMPGFIYLCRIALIEAMLIFFFSFSLILFFFWVRTNDERMLFFSSVTLGLAFIAKYQALVAGIIMLVSIFFLCRKNVPTRLVKFLVVFIIAGAIIILPWFFVTYSSGMFGTWLYVLKEGSEERLMYSTRFSPLIFYLIEMTYPYMDIHPISLPVYVFALLGLCLWLWRRRPQDKFSLVWFFVVYSFFTLIPNKNWRFVVLLFPVLAISASDCILFFWDKAKQSFKKNISKIVAIFFIFLLAFLLIYSSNDAYYWIKKDQVHIPVDEASQYLTERLTSNETIAVLCASNLFNTKVMKFYLDMYGFPDQRLWQYPEKAVDAYTLLFNETTLIEHSEALHVKYLLLYEYGNITFFQSEWRAHNLLETLLNTDRFIVEEELGNFPRRIFIMRFLSTS